MFTTATLTISGFHTDLRLTGDNWQPGDAHERINVLGNGDDYTRKTAAAYFRAGADTELTRRGYARVGDWQYEAGRDVHVTTVGPTADRVG